MNGVHDLGGMQCMGPIHHEANEPVFHFVWEARVYAINRALGAWHKWNLDAWRYDIERLPPPDYLRMSYYEKWLAALENRVVKYGMVTKEELASGKPTPGSARATPVFTVAMARVVAGSQYQSPRPYATAPVRARQDRQGRARPRRVSVPGHEFSVPWRKAPACVFRAVRGARALGRRRIS